MRCARSCPSHSAVHVLAPYRCAARQPVSAATAPRWSLTVRSGSATETQREALVIVAVARVRVGLPDEGGEVGRTAVDRLEEGLGCPAIALEKQRDDHEH